MMAILTVLSLAGPHAGAAAECARVARHRVVVLGGTPRPAARSGMLRDYLPSASSLVDRAVLPKMHEVTPPGRLGRALARGGSAVPVAARCVVRFPGRSWARPPRTLRSCGRAGISLFTRMDDADRAGLERLRAISSSGAWRARRGTAARA